MPILDRFRRVTTGGRFLPQIDGLRFVAIGAVVAYHSIGYFEYYGRVPFAPSVVTGMLDNGFRGVELFFMISGFILGLPFVYQYLGGGKRVSLRKYFLRRLTRLEPPYILSLLLMFVFVVLGKGHAIKATLPHLFAQMVYLHNAIFGTGDAVNGVGWSLEIEVQFYCLVPVICLALRIQNKLLRRSAFLAAIVLLTVTQQLIPNPGRLHLTLLFYAQYFLGGILLSDIFVADWRETPNRSLAWDVVALLGWPAIFLVPPSLAVLELPLLIFITYYATFRGTISSRLFSSDALTIIGGMCYTIYLIHYPIISAIGRFTRFRFTTLGFLPYFVLQTLLCSLGVLILSATYFALIERPCMYKDWPQRFWAKLSGARRLPLSTPQRIET